MPVYLDLPNERVDTLPFAIGGWFATDVPDPSVAVRIDGCSVPFVLVNRPDVRAAPGLQSFATINGISALSTVRTTRLEQAVLIEIDCEGEVASRICTVAIPLQDWASEEQTELARQARSWCLVRLRCPTCAASRDNLSVQMGMTACVKCGTVYDQGTQALNFISARAGAMAGVVASDNVSSNPYTPEALALIASVTGRGGWVLDCGAGSRERRLPNVVNVEIADYSSTDVLAIGEALPFADGSFDAVLSLAVLEHVRDPFACARELVRVLRPGGELLVDVPFMQPVHGYPDHYYNMTQAGLRNLFAGLGEVVHCHVPPHGHPIFGVQWLLAAYLGGLPSAARAQFAAMTVDEVASIQPHAFLSEPAASALPPRTQDVIGCLNSFRFRKPSDPSGEGSVATIRRSGLLGPSEGGRGRVGLQGAAFQG